MHTTVFRERGYQFFFLSKKEKRMHVHIYSSDGEAKFWLEPEIALASKHRLSGEQLAVVQSIVTTRHRELSRAWREYFSSNSD